MGHRLAGDRRGLRRLPARREDDHARRVVQPFPAGEEAGARRRGALGGAPRHPEDHRRAQATGRQKSGADGTAARRKQKELERSFSVVELNAEYVRLRTIKSLEEIDWLR